MKRFVRPGLGIIAVCAAVTVPTFAYVTFSRWATSTVLFFVNPQSTDLSASAAEAAVYAAMNAWNSAGSAFRYTYGGRVSDTTHTYDQRNVVMFRNSTNGSTIASTYYWISNATGQLVDTDIVFWDGAYQLFTGTSGCSNGVYVEDVATHEFGHALGLKHSPLPEASMYTYYYLCTQTERTLDVDDIEGVKSLYGSGAPPVNTPPVVTIVTPTSGQTIAQGTATTFSGSATDVQDGNLTGYMTWTSSIDGPLGTGNGFSRTLSAGAHVITATVADSAAAQASNAVTMTVTTSAPAPTPPAPGGLSLTATGYKVKGLQKVNLSWSGFTTGSVDVYRNGAKVGTTANDGSETDPINLKGAGSYTYKVCAAGTSTCSNDALVTF